MVPIIREGVCCLLSADFRMFVVVCCSAVCCLRMLVMLTVVSWKSAAAVVVVIVIAAVVAVGLFLPVVCSASFVVCWFWCDGCMRLPAVCWFAVVCIC